MKITRVQEKLGNKGTCGRSAGLLGSQFRVWTLRKKMPTKKGSWWLNWVQNKKETNKRKTEPTNHFYIGASHTNHI